MKISKVLLIVLVVIVMAGCKKSTTVKMNEVKLMPSGHNMSAFQAIQLTGGIFIAAAHEADNHNRGLLVAVDNNGEMIWQHELPLTDKRLTAIAATNDNCFMVASYDDSLLNQIFVSKYDALGNTIWRDSIYFAPQSLGTVVLTVSGDNAAIIGAVKNSAPSAVYFLPVNSAGQTGTITQMGSDDPTHQIYLLKAARQNDGYVFSGYFYKTNWAGGTGIYRGYCLKADLQGTLIWNYRPLPTNQNCICVAMDQNSDGNIIQLYTNYIAQQGSEDAGNSYFSAYGYISANVFNSQTGIITDSASFGVDSLAIYPVISPTTDNGHIIAVTNNYNISTQYFLSHITLIKTDNNLKKEWQNQLNIPAPARVFGVFENNKGGYTVFAAVESFTKQNDIAVINTDNLGNMAGN